jgi:prepilin-type N-terminal cleavage/methylation domain-containing protein
VGDPMKARRRGERGFTLIELVIVVTVVGVIAGLFVRYLNEGTRMFEAVDTRKSLTMEARQAMIRTIREIRQVRSSSDVLAADASNLSFYGVDDSLYAFHYPGVPGADLTFQRGAVSGAAATDVDSLAFEYVKNDGSPAAPLVSPDETDIYRVRVLLRLRRGDQSVVLCAGTYLRNVP